MNREQRQRIADTICDEWVNSQGDLESNALFERLVGEGMRLDSSELLDFLDELDEANLIGLQKPVFIGNRRITDVDVALCEYPLNY
jgi:hypothetical protein